MRKLIISAALVASTVFTGAAQVNAPDAQGYLARAVEMYNDCNYVGCTDQLKYLKDLKPGADAMEQADYYLAMSAMRLGKADAGAMLRYFIWRYPTSPLVPQVRLSIAQLLMSQSRYGEACEALQRLSANLFDSSSRESYTASYAYCLLKLGEYKKALPMWQSLRSSKRYGSDARFYEGYIAYIEKDYTKARQLFDGCDTSKAPGNMADYYLAQIHYLDGNWSQAATMATRLMSSSDVESSFKTEAARVAGESYYQMGDDTRAIPLLREYVANIAEPLPSTLYILGVADYRQGNYAAAIETLSPVASLDNAIGQSANLFIGQSMMQQANYSGAMIAFNRALQMDYDRGVQESAYYNYAVAKTEGGRIPFGNSVATFEEFLRRYPNSRYASQIREYLVSGYMTDNNYEAALTSLDLISNPSEKLLGIKQQVLYTLGTREVKSGDYTTAVNHLLRARELNSYNANVAADTELWLGEAYYNQGKYAEAAKAYTTAINSRKLSADNSAQAQYALGYAYFQQGDIENTESTFTKLYNSNASTTPQVTADILNRLGDCRYMSHDFEGASRLYSKAYETYPATGDYALYQDALMKGFRRDHNGKISGLQTMLRKFPSSSLVPQAYLEIGEAYGQLGRNDRAIESYSMVGARYPDSSYGRQANLLLALCYLNDGKNDQAIETYKALITKAPGSEEGQQATDNLRELMAEQGALDEYADFIASVPGAAQIEASELEAAAFTAAERDYLNNGTTGRITEYLDRYPTGASRATALSYAITANANIGNHDATVRYADELIANYPDNSYVPQAVKARAESLAAQGKGEMALEAYARLIQVADTPEMLNEARMGTLRTARDLGLNEQVIETADIITQSSTITKAQRSEAVYSHAYASAALGNTDAAFAGWQSLTADLDDIYGTMSAFSIANTKFSLGDLDAATTAVEALIDSNTPYNYWLARGYILLSDICRAQGKTFEAEQYLISLRENYPDAETDIFEMIESRLNNK